MASSSPANVAIIGAGLSGLALALFLTRSLPNVTITIYEVRPATHPCNSGSINLTPNALRVLDHLGVYKSIALQGFNFDSLSFRTHDLGLLAEVPMASVKDYGYQSLRIERRIVHAALLKETQSEPRIEIVYDSKCSSIVDSDAGVAITFSTGATATADLLIGCDGIHSTVRKFVLPDPADHDPKYTGQYSIGGHISAAEIAKYKPGNVHYPLAMLAPNTGAGTNFMIWPYTNAGDELIFFTSLPRPVEEADWNAIFADKQKLKDTLLETYTATDSPWAPLVKNTVELSDPSRYRFWAFYEHNLPEKYHSDSGRIILIGDAAHAMPPSGGQGAAMAFEDAESLAYTLAHAAGSREEGKLAQLGSEALVNLRAWSDHRLQRQRTMQGFKKRMSDMRMGGSGIIGGLVFTMKLWMVWALGRLGMIGGQARIVNNYDAKTEIEALFGCSVAREA